LKFVNDPKRKKKNKKIKEQKKKKKKKKRTTHELRNHARDGDAAPQRPERIDLEQNKHNIEHSDDIRRTNAARATGHERRVECATTRARSARAGQAALVGRRTVCCAQSIVESRDFGVESTNLIAADTRTDATRAHQRHHCHHKHQHKYHDC
jgi:hypothetical protein